MNTEAIRNDVKSLKSQSKQEVFGSWVRECGGRISSADIREQRKSWMIYDLIVRRYSEAAAQKYA